MTQYNQHNKVYPRRDRPRRRSLFAGILAPASCKRTPHTPQVSLHQPLAGPPPFRQGRLWEVRTAGRCRHRPLRNSTENPCVGADVYIGPVAPIFKSCVGRRALTPPRCRSGYRTAGWGQPALQCLAPLPKGGLGGRIATTSDIGRWFRNDMGFAWSAVHGRRVTARAAPPPHLSALHFSPSRLFDIVNDDFRPPCGRFGHPANF